MRPANESFRVSTILLVIAGVLLADFAVRVFYVRLILPQFEAKPPFFVTQHAPDPAAETIATVTTDGYLLRGTVFRSEGPARGVILFCPELDGNRWSAAYYAEGLIQAGFDVVSFDFRGQGNSETQPGYSPIHWPTDFEMKDVDAAIAWIHEQPEWLGLPLGTFGISRGSLIALMAAGDHPEVRAVCGEGTYTIDRLVEHFTKRWAQLYIPPWALVLIPMWHLRITLRMVRWVSERRRSVRYAIVERRIRALRKIPVLLISGERDSYVHPEVTAGLVRAIGGSLSRLWLAPQSKHNQARDMHPSEYDRRLVEFFSTMAPKAEPVEPIVTAA